MRKFLSEIRRRNVHKIAIGYLAVGWLITEVMSTALPAIAAPDWIAKLVLLVFLLGLPIALWFSWEFEVTPEGIKRTYEVDKNESITSHTGQKLNRIVIGILVAAVGMLLLDKFVGPTPVQNSETESPITEDVTTAGSVASIAVLPFSDFSEGGNQAYIANGIADTVLHLLAQVPDLKVAARTSSFAYQGKDTDIATIASELGVGAVLEGSVQKAGERLRVIAQLIRASDQSHLWSQTFDNSTADVFAIQDEIAQSVLEVLRPDALTKGAPESERTDTAAYDHYLKGKELLTKQTAETVEAALQELQAATLIDPTFVPALIELGYTYMDLNGVTPRTWAEIEPLAEASFRRAVELAPDDASALAGLGTFIRNAGYDPLSAIPYLERALELNPNDARVLGLYGELANTQGKFLEAADSFKRAYALDPNNPEQASRYGFQLAALGRYDEARTVANRLILLQPGQPPGHQLLVTIADINGLIDVAIIHALDVLKTDQQAYLNYYSLAELFAQLDDQQIGEVWYQRTVNKTEDYIPTLLFWTKDEVHKYEAHAERDVELYPGWNAGQRNYITALFLNRKLEQGIEALARYEQAYETERDAGSTAAAGVMAARLGKTDLAERLLNRARARNKLMLDAGFLVSRAQATKAMIAVADNDSDAAFAALASAISNSGASLRHLKMHPVWDPLRDDPRFAALLAKYKKQLDEQRKRLAGQGI